MFSTPDPISTMRTCRLKWSTSPPVLEQSFYASLLKIDYSIVAVHGLGSNVDWSWTWRDKARPGLSVNWLKDPHMLPNVILKSRIIVYNYDSRWHANAPRTRLQLCGEDLVRNLHAFRKGLQDCPVVFVGHSLGGLVVQHVSPETISLWPLLTKPLLRIGSLICRLRRRISIPSPTHLRLRSARVAL